MATSLYQQVRLAIYDHLLTTGTGPTVDEIAATLALPTAQIAEAFQTLQRKHLIYFNPLNAQVQMAWPLSGIATDYAVQVKDVTIYANCAWDAFGIPAMLGIDADFDAPCAQTEAMLHIRIRDGQLEQGEGVVHFLVPPTQWYDDLVYT